MARAGYFPSLSAVAGLSGNNSDFADLFDYKTIFWGLRLNWTLFDGFATNQSIQRALRLRSATPRSRLHRPSATSVSK